MINVQIVRDYLNQIIERAAENDHEGAHEIEDKLWGYVLAQVADGVANYKYIATLALESRTINFKRWCG